MERVTSLHQSILCVLDWVQAPKTPPVTEVALAQTVMHCPPGAGPAFPLLTVTLADSLEECPADWDEADPSSL